MRYKVRYFAVHLVRYVSRYFARVVHFAVLCTLSSWKLILLNCSYCAYLCFTMHSSDTVTPAQTLMTFAQFQSTISKGGYLEFTLNGYK